MRIAAGRLIAPIVRVARTEIGALAALLILAGGVLAFFDIAEDSAQPGGRRMDMAVLRWLRPSPDLSDPRGPPWLAHAAGELTALGGVAVLVVVALIAIGFLVLKRRFGSALMVIVSLAGGIALSEGLKGVFGRDRPPEVYRALEVANPSFPSGHALLSAAAYLTLGSLLAGALDGKRHKAYVMGAATALALTVGLTRVYLGVHWASDVLAGWSLGAAWAMACWLASYFIERVRRRPAG